MIFGPVFLIPLFFVALVVSTVAALVIFSFAIVGGPAPCEPGGPPIVVSEENADSFQIKWDVFDATLDAGSPASVTFTEGEVTSRAIRAAEGPVDDQDWIQNFQVCLHDGYGEISGTVNLPSFLDVRFKVRGTARIEDTLTVDVHEIDVGSLPGFVGDMVADTPDDSIEALDEDDLEHEYDLTLREGEVQIDGRP